jgi:hypothetical protein
MAELNIEMDFLVVSHAYVMDHLARFETMITRLLSQLGYENRPLQETP